MKVMTEEKVSVNDLWAIIRPRLAKFQNPKDVHFTPEGSQFMAEAVARLIKETLNQS